MAPERSKSLLGYRYAARASQGRRARQEDFSVVWCPPGTYERGITECLLAVLADGMGGHVSGQLASRLACETYLSSFLGAASDIGPRMADAIETSNRSIAAAVAEDGRLQGMGCTLLASHLDGDGLRWVSVGDSALLLYRNGRLHRLNADHSLGASLDKQAAAGIISLEAAKNDPRRHALHSALTGGRIPLQDLELQPLALEARDWLILASDGLLTVSGDDIASAICNFAGATPDTLADHLMALVDAHLNPRQDNTTIVAVEVVVLQ
ncbi:MAG: protein phosphatase 2C domain-containing protein [Hyphomicrobium sp.]|jgi:protein phosphatase